MVIDWNSIKGGQYICFGKRLNPLKKIPDRQSLELKHILKIKGKITSNVLVSPKEKETQQQTDFLANGECL